MGLGMSNKNSVYGCFISNSLCGRNSVFEGTKRQCSCSASLHCGGCDFHTGVSFGMAGSAILGMGLTGVCRGFCNPNMRGSGV